MTEKFNEPKSQHTLKRNDRRRRRRSLFMDYIPEVKQYHPSIKIVMITAHNSLQEIRCAINRGADYFITKPFDSTTIRNIIDLLIPQKTVDISYK